MNRHLKRPTFRWFSWVILMTFVGLLVGLVGAQKADAVDLPGVEVCKKTAPFAQTPQQGLAGALGERPVVVTNSLKPSEIWSTGGFAGLRTSVYDLGCGVDPTTWSRVASANSDAGAANGFTSLGNALVAITDSVDRRAWSPGWITSFLEDFARQVTGQANVKILIPYLGVGILLTILVLLYRSSDGDYTAAAQAIGWTVVVITITTMLLASPMAASRAAQQAGGLAVSTLHGGTSASDAQTNEIVEHIQYQGWLRRTFGSEVSPAALQYGPALLASTRVSWTELDAINRLAPADQPKARTALTEKKAEQFVDIAEKIKDMDPGAYRYLTGEESAWGEALLELAFVVASSVFRLAVGILMITCVVMLTVLAVAWVIISVILPLPKIFNFSGRELGMLIINNAVAGLRYVLEAALASWVFGIYLQACLGPGIKPFWSLVLLIIGTGIAWTLIAPIAKFKAIATLGRARGDSATARWLKTLFSTYIGARLAGVTLPAKSAPEESTVTPAAAPTESRPLDTVYATVYVPPTPPVATIEGTIVPAIGPGVYSRPDPEPGPGPLPPPDDSKVYRIYSDDDDNEGART